MRFHLTFLLAFLAFVAWDTSSQAYDFKTDFDSWPSPGCYEFSKPVPASQCEGMHMEPYGDWTNFGSNSGQVDSFPECKSGKCFRGVWPANETSHKIRPPVEGFTNGKREIYFSFDFKMGADHSDGVPYQYKLMRLIGNTGVPPLSLYANYHEIAMESSWASGSHGGGLVCVFGFQWSNHINEWVHIELALRMNSAPGVNDAECDLKATLPNGTTLRDHRTGLRVSDATNNSYSRMAWILANVSNAIGPNPGWPWNHGKTLFVENICLSDNFDAGSGFCAQGPTPTFPPEPPVMIEGAAP